MRIFFLALVLAALLPFPLLAETVTRCTAAGGHVTWTNRPCPPGQKAEAVEVNPAVTDSRELRDWARRAPAPRNSIVRARPEPRPARIRDQVACDNARRDLRFEAGSSVGRRGRLGAVREEVRQACGTR